MKNDHRVLLSKIYLRFPSSLFCYFSMQIWIFGIFLLNDHKGAELRMTVTYGSIERLIQLHRRCRSRWADLFWLCSPLKRSRWMSETNGYSTVTIHSFSVRLLTQREWDGFISSYDDHHLFIMSIRSSEHLFLSPSFIQREQLCTIYCEQRIKKNIKSKSLLPIAQWGKCDAEDAVICCQSAMVPVGSACWVRGWFFSRERLFWNQTRMTFSSNDKRRESVSICVGSG